MNIFMTCPGAVPHGGIRVILEWATRLARKHQVYLRVPKAMKGDFSWFGGLGAIQVVKDIDAIWKSDRLIVSSPHDADLLSYPGAPRSGRFAFMQMLEGMFRPDDLGWQRKCKWFEQESSTLIGISKWNLARVVEQGRTLPFHYVGNGVNLEQFPISTKPKTGNCVLIEGWSAFNPTKDVDRLGPAVAKRLRRDGHKVLAYSQSPVDAEYAEVPHEFHVRPNLATLNSLYERATVLIKASKYDARSCSPMEAMTKGTVTARAIIEGDDDLTTGVNSVRCAYEEEALYNTVKTLLEVPELRESLAENCLAYVQKYSWDYWMGEIEKVLQLC